MEIKNNSNYLFFKVLVQNINLKKKINPIAKKIFVIKPKTKTANKGKNY